MLFSRSLVLSFCVLTASSNSISDLLFEIGFTPMPSRTSLVLLIGASVLTSYGLELFQAHDYG